MWIAHGARAPHPAISLSGDTLAVDALLEDSTATGVYNDTAFTDNDDGVEPNSGAVHIFR